MRPALRQRLIGVGLLLLLLLILVPWALQVPDKLQLQLDAKVAPAPEVIWQPLVSPINDDSLQQVADNISREREESVATELDAKHKLGAYAVRLARYATRSEAIAMRQRLNDAGYRAYVRQLPQGFALYAGPELDMSRLKLQQQRLNEDKRFSFSDEQLVNYRP